MYNHLNNFEFKRKIKTNQTKFFFFLHRHIKLKNSEHYMFGKLYDNYKSNFL